MDTSLLSTYQQNSWGKVDQQKFRREIVIFEGEINSAMAILVNDGKMRYEYMRATSLMSKELETMASHGMISWGQASKEAHETRNIVMNLIRERTSPLERAIAEAIKKDGKSFNDLLGKYTVKFFGEGAEFSHLSDSQQNQVYAEIVKSAGRQSPKVNRMAEYYSRGGRVLIFMSLAISIYLVYEADDHLAEAERQLAITIAGVEGGWIGGALAGAMCTVGAEICIPIVAIATFVGGALGA